MTAKNHSETGGATQFYRPPAGVLPELREVGRELSRLEESARFSSQTQYEQSKFWRVFNYSLGIPAFALGVAGGAAVLVEMNPRWIAGVLALIAGVLAGVLTILGAERRADHATASGNAYRDVQTDARQLLLVDLQGLDLEAARQGLSRLTDRYGEISRTADVPGRTAYRRAKMNVERGGQAFGIDSENGPQAVPDHGPAGP